MLKFNLRLNHLKFDRKKWMYDVNKSLVKLIKDGAIVWINTVYPLVPVATGMARSSLVPLAEKLEVTIPIPYTGYSIQKTGKRAGRRIKRPDRRAEGRALGTPSNKVIKIYRNQYGIFRIDFNWETLVPHWAGLDGAPRLESKTNPKGGHPAWLAAKTGNEIMMDYIVNEFPSRMPHVSSYILATPVRTD